MLPIRTVCVTLGLLAVAPLGAEADTPCMDCPTACPCTIEGDCRPGQPWGYYRTRWNRWPGDFDSAGPDADRGPSPLAPVREPDPTVEDQAAPPRSEPRAEEQADESEPKGGKAPVAESEEFDLPPLPGIDRGPSDESTDAPAAEGDDAPPGLPPFSPLRGLGPGAGPVPGQGYPGQGSPTPRYAPQGGTPLPTEDAAPPAPAGFAQILQNAAGLRRLPVDAAPGLPAQLGGAVLVGNQGTDPAVQSAVYDGGTYLQGGQAPQAVQPARYAPQAW